MSRLKELDQKKVLKCILCDKKFSERDVANLDFFIDIHTCYVCLRGETEKPFAQNCFGKFTMYAAGGAVIGYGYDPVGAVECRELCSARMACVLFANGKIRKMRKAVQLGNEIEEAMPFRQKDSLMSKAFIMCLDGTTVRKLKRFVELHDGNLVRILRVLRSESYRGKTWRFDEQGKNIKVYLDLTK